MEQRHVRGEGGDGTQETQLTRSEIPGELRVTGLGRRSPLSLS